MEHNYCMQGQASGYRLNPWSPSGTIRNFEPGISLEQGVNFHGEGIHIFTIYFGNCT